MFLKYSIILYTYRHPERVKEIYKVCPINQEVIIIDVDPKTNELSKLNARYVRTEDIACATAINLGAVLASNDVLVFIQDDIKLKGMDIINLAKSFMEGDYPVLSVNILEPSNWVNFTGNEIQALEGGDEQLGRIFPFFATTKKLLHNYPIDESFYPAYFDDLDFIHRLYVAGYSVFVNYDITVIHEPGTFRVADRYTDYNEKNLEYYIRKWGGEPFKEKYTIPFGDEI